MTIQRNSKNRSLAWEEDDAPADTRFRRAQQVTPAGGRNLPGMPLSMPDLDEDEDFPRAGRQRFDTARAPWWRPATRWGRIFLATGALLVMGILATTVVLARTYLERDGRFRIAGSSNIQSTGLGEVTRAELMPVFGEDIGRNIFFVPLSQRRKQLENIPWVERATVMRLLPDQIRVSVVERKPVAFVRQGQQIGLVDANGVLLTMPAATMSKHHYSFPVVTGIDAGDPLPSRRTRMAVYQRLIGELDGNGQRFSEQISEIDLTDPEDARVLMPEQGGDILAHLGDDQFLARYQRYKAHIAEWRQQYPRLMAVDLRYDQQVVLKMQPGSGPSNAFDPGNKGKTLIEPSPAPTGAVAQAAAPAKPSAGVKSSAAKIPAKKSVKAAAHKLAPKTKSVRDKKKHPDAKHTTKVDRQKAAVATHPDLPSPQAE